MVYQWFESQIFYIFLDLIITATILLGVVIQLDH